VEEQPGMLFLQSVSEKNDMFHRLNEDPLMQIRKNEMKVGLIMVVMVMMMMMMMMMTAMMMVHTVMVVMTEEGVMMLIVIVS
jgi:hypothetical protein